MLAYVSTYSAECSADWFADYILRIGMKVPVTKTKLDLENRAMTQDMKLAGRLSQYRRSLAPDL